MRLQNMVTHLVVGAANGLIVRNRPQVHIAGRLNTETRRVNLSA
jgi:hypothetical protein